MHLNNFNKKFGSGRKDCRAGKMCGGKILLKMRSPESCLSTGEKEPVHRDRLILWGDRR